MVQRLTYRRRHSYATRSNKVRKVKTPGVLRSWSIPISQQWIAVCSRVFIPVYHPGSHS